MKKQTLIFASFAAVAAVILLLGHLVLYITVSALFTIPTSDGRTILKIVLAVQGVSFPITSLIVHWKETKFTNALYALASIWLGGSLYITMATVLGVLIDFANEELHGHLHTQWMAAALLAIAVGYTIYGIWNAYTVRVRNVTVRIPNLPTSWQGQRVVQLSDVHLGPILRQRFCRMVVRLANAQNPAAVFVTGDLFDGGGLDLNSLASPLADLRSTHGTFYITGNHETYVGEERALAAIESLPLQKLNDRKVEVDGLQIMGMYYPKFGEQKDFATILQQLDRTKPSILLYHEPKHLDVFAASGANLMLAGHTHVGQLWPFHAITHRVYGIYDVGLHPYQNLQVYTSTGVGTWGPPMRTGNSPEIVVITLECA